MSSTSSIRVLQRLAASASSRCLQQRAASISSSSGSNATTATGAWGLVDKVALTADGSTFVAWHPAPAFPYEHSRPIPHVEQRDRSAVLKDASLTTAMHAFRTRHPEIARQELSRVTYTTKHRWFPRARDAKAKRTPMDREYL